MEETQMADYAWVIDGDKLADLDAPAGTNANAKGLMGPAGITPEQIAQLQARPRIGARFRMLDDDGEVYYLGRLLGDSLSEQGFAPLDDFGMPNAGCTSIEYADVNGAWVVL